MPDVFTSLRREVLIDIGRDIERQKKITSGRLYSEVEVGGTGGSYDDTGNTLTDALEPLKDGIDYFADPIVPFGFDSAPTRFATMDTFLYRVVADAIYPLRVMPITSTDPDDDGNPTFTFHVHSTDEHPVVFDGHFFTFDGADFPDTGDPDLSSYVPADGDPDVKVLVTLDPNYGSILSDPSGAVGIIDDPSIVNDLTLWPRDKFCLAIITFTSGMEGINWDLIQDVRSFIRGGVSSGIVPVTLVVAASDSKDPTRGDYKCTGTNDQTTIATAIAALPSSGGSIALLEGTYSFGATLAITKSNVLIEGQGDSTVIHRAFSESTANNAGVITVGDGGTATPTGIRFRDFLIDGIKGTYAGSNNHGILFKRSNSHCRIDHVSVINCGGDGVRLLADTAPVGDGNVFCRFSGLYLASNSGAGFNSIGQNTWCTVLESRSQANSSYGYKFDTSTRCRLFNSESASNASDGILLKASDYAVVVGNSSTTNTLNGITIDTSDQVTLSNNNFSENDQDGVYLKNGTYAAVFSNQCYQNGRNGIRTYYDPLNAVTWDANLLIGNNCSNCTEESIYLLGAMGTGLKGNILKDSGVTFANLVMLKATSETDATERGCTHTYVGENVFGGGLRAFTIGDRADRTLIGFNTYINGATFSEAGDRAIDGTSVSFIGDVTVSSSYAGLTTYIRGDAASNPVSVLLPDPSLEKGRRYNFQKVDATANAVTANGLIRGLGSHSITKQWASFEVISNGTSWDLIYDTSPITPIPPGDTTGDGSQVGVRYVSFTTGSMGVAFDADGTRSNSSPGANIFTLDETPLKILGVFRNHSPMVLGVDYTITDRVIVLMPGAEAVSGETVRVLYVASVASTESAVKVKLFDAGDGGAFDADPDRTGGTTSHYNLTLDDTPDEILFIYRNHSVMVEGQDYTLTGAVVAFIDGAKPLAGETVTVVYRLSRLEASVLYNELFTAGDGGAFDADPDRTGGTASHFDFTTSRPLGDIVVVIRNHDCLNTDEYSVASNTVSIFSGSRPLSGEDVQIIYNSSVDFELHLSGDVTGAVSSTVVEAIQGSAVPNPGASENGKTLVYDDSSGDFMFDYGLAPRGTVNGITSSIADNTEEEITVTLGKGYNIYRISSDRAARVRVYNSQASSTADAARAEGTPPTGEHGVIAEVITTSLNLDWYVAPALPGYGLDGSNNATATAYVRVKNKSGSTNTVSITIERVLTER